MRLIMLTSTKIAPLSFPFSITYRDRMLSLGSCFSVNITQKLFDLGYTTLSNPSGITFNPLSLLATTQMISGAKSLHRDQLNCQNELWSHPGFHGSFNNMDQTICLQEMTSSIENASNYVNDVSVILITLGTCKVYVDKASGQVVNNCHKRPSAQFEEKLLSIPEVVSALTELKQLISGLSSKEVRYVFSVSPVRHIKNGLVMDRRSKSIALLSVHDIVDAHDDCHYFPAYEILTDELRDYRYYAEDMIHPSAKAVAYVFGKFISSLLDPKEEGLRKSVSHIQQRRLHRPLFEHTQEHQRFIKKLNEDLVTLKSKYPFLKI